MMFNQNGAKKNQKVTTASS